MVTVRDATVDMSHVQICSKCLPEVLSVIPEASVVSSGVFTKVVTWKSG